MYATEHQAALLRAAVEEIKKHPETFDMRVWANACGTTCCLAGQIVRNNVSDPGWADLVQRQREDEQKPLKEWGQPIRVEAERLLGLTDEVTERIFMHSEWPEQFIEFDTDYDEDGVLDFTAKPATPEQLEARVEWWIQTGE
jgi:hypothetical protein